MGTNVVYVVRSYVNDLRSPVPLAPMIYLFSTRDAAESYARKEIDEYLYLRSYPCSATVAYEKLKIYGQCDNVVYISCVALDTEKNIMV